MNKLIESWKKNKQGLVCAVIIAAAIILMYGRAAGFKGDVWDDFLYLGMFNHGHSFSDLLVQLRTPILGLYSPLVTLSLYIDRLLLFNGNIVAASYCWNIFYFIIAAWGLYALFRELRLPGKEGKMWQLPHFWAVAGVLLWALHPQRPESVVWISERKDVLLGCCTWWSWFLFIRGYRNGRFSFSALFLFLLSFGIKPMLLLFPGVLALWILFETKSKNWRDYRFVFPFAAVSAAAILCHLLNMFHTPGFSKSFVLGERLAITLWNCGNYAISALIPLQAGPFHPYYPLPGWHNTVILGVILLCYFLCLWLLPRYRSGVLAGVGAAMICFGLFLAPASGIVAIGNADWADRYNLLPSAMSVLVITALAAGAWNAKQKYCRYCGGMFFSMIFALYVGLCNALVPVWKNKQTVVLATLRTPVPNYRVTFIPALYAIGNKDAKTFEKYKKLLLLEPARGNRKEVIRIFLETADAKIDFDKGNVDSALKKMDKILKDRHWVLIKFSSLGFPKIFFTELAEVYLKRNQPLKAAYMYDRLAVCYNNRPERIMYQGIASYHAKKYRQSVVLLEKAQKILKREKLISKYLQIARKAALEEKKGCKDSPSKLSSETQSVKDKVRNIK